MSFAITAAAAYFLGSKVTHPLDYLLMGGVMCLAQGFERKRHRALVYLAAIAVAVVMHLGIIPHEVFGFESIDYHNCTKPPASTFRSAAGPMGNRRRV